MKYITLNSVYKKEFSLFADADILILFKTLLKSHFRADRTWQSRLPHTCGIIFYSSLQKSFTSIPSSLSYSSTYSSSKRPFGKVKYMAFSAPKHINLLFS